MPVIHGNLLVKARLLRVVVSLTGLCAVLVGCNLPDGSSPAVATDKISASIDCQALKGILVQSYFEQLTEPQRCSDCLRRTSHATISPVQSVTSSFGVNDTQAWSSVAMDGRGLVYTLAAGVLTIRRLTSSGDVEELGELPLAIRNAELLLDEIAARVIVSGQESLRDLKPSMRSMDADTSAPRLISNGTINSGRAMLVFVDVSDPARPAIMQQLVMDGVLIGRMHAQGQYHLVTRTRTTVPAVVKTDPNVQVWIRTVSELRVAGVDTSNAEQALRDAIGLALANDTGLSQANERHTGLINNSLRSPSCENIIQPASTVRVRERLTLTSISAEGRVLNSVAVLGSGQSVYGTQHNLYVLQPLFAENVMTTSITQFELNPAGASYQRSATVNGTVSGPASMDEQGDILRIVTTHWAHDGMGEDITLAALNAASTTGILEPLASSELVRDAHLSAVSFAGNRLFVVTYGEGNTLHSFDIENASHPLALGKQKNAAVEFSLVALGTERLMMIGHTLSEIDSTRQLHLSVLDIANPASPPQVCERNAMSSVPITSSWGNAQGLTFYQPRGLLALPVTEIGDHGEIEFSGIVVYHLNHSDECKEVARIADDSQTVEGFIAQRIGIAQVGRRLFLLKVSPGELKAISLKTWSAVF